MVVVGGPKQPPSPLTGRGPARKKKAKRSNLDDDESVEGAPAPPPHASPPPPEDTDDEEEEAGNETTTDTQLAIAAPPVAATETATAPTPMVLEILQGSNDTENAVAPTPPTLAAPVREVAVPVGTPKSTKVSNETEVSEMQMEYILQEPEVCKELEADLKTYVTKNVFPGAKFPLATDREMLHCRVAARSGSCKLPEGVTPEGFGKQFRKIVRKRQKELRANAHASAKWKFDSKFGWRLPFGVSWN